ncbi:MAG: 3-ketoacyl-ACP reductase [Verrucomicrobiota bacterium]|nr:3-ketoacyl-ACP reductase [Verrucomicrobiota bacterium]
MSKPIALITGGSRGIGFGVAQALALQGYDLAINGLRTAEEASAAIESLRTLGARVEYCRGDISCATDRKAILDTVRQQFGALHLLVNNAGVAPKVRNDILEMEETSWDFVMNCNLKGPFFLTQAVANWMIRQKQLSPDTCFSIITITSISATVVSTNRGEYCVSKAGLAMVSQLFATRLGEHGIAVYEVRPGVIKTDMTTSVSSKYDKLLAEGLCIQGRWGLPEDVGRTVASLARGDLPYSTGQVIMVDGGLTVPRL